MHNVSNLTSDHELLIRMHDASNLTSDHKLLIRMRDARTTLDADPLMEDATEDSNWSLLCLQVTFESKV